MSGEGIQLKKQLTYKEYGHMSGPLLVFLHGGGVNGWMWDKQVEYFKHYHCLVPTLPGHGLQTEKVPFSIHDCALEIIQLIEEKRTEKDVILIGFSLGAQIVIEILSVAPNLASYAVINSANVMNTRFMDTMVAPLIKMTSGLVKNKTFAKMQAKQLYISEQYFETYYRESIEMDTDNLINILKESFSYEMPSSFSESNAKILVTVGEKEKPIMKKSAAKIAEQNSNCKEMIIRRIGHGFPLADPDSFNETVEAWINDN